MGLVTYGGYWIREVLCSSDSLIMAMLLKSTCACRF